MLKSKEKTISKSDKIKFTEKEKHNLITILNENYATHIVRIFLTEGVDYYINEWKNIAHEINTNKYCCYEDFTNDLTTREILEDIMDNVKSDKKNLILGRIKNYDNLVKSKITFVDLNKSKPYLHFEDKWIKTHPKDKYWWYWGEFKDLTFE